MTAEQATRRSCPGAGAVNATHHESLLPPSGWASSSNRALGIKTQLSTCPLSGKNYSRWAWAHDTCFRPHPSAPRPRALPELSSICPRCALPVATLHPSGSPRVPKPHTPARVGSVETGWGGGIREGPQAGGLTHQGTSRCLWGGVPPGAAGNNRDDLALEHWRGVVCDCVHA